MQHERRLRFGEVPDSIGGIPVGPGENRISSDEFLLRDPRFAIY
jgi:hypothetical protein